MQGGLAQENQLNTGVVLPPRQHVHVQDTAQLCFSAGTTSWHVSITIPCDPYLEYSDLSQRGLLNLIVFVTLLEFLDGHHLASPLVARFKHNSIGAADSAIDAIISVGVAGMH